MSVREKPVSNRILALKEQERAYKKHLAAVANAKPTIDTSPIDVPNRLKVKEVHDEHYREMVLHEYSERERMIAEARGEEMPEETLSTFEVQLEKSRSHTKQKSRVPRTKETPESPKTEKKRQLTESVKIGYASDVIIEEEEVEEPEEQAQPPPVQKKSKLPSRQSPQRSRIPVRTPPSEQSKKRTSKLPVSHNSPGSPKTPRRTGAEIPAEEPLFNDEDFANENKVIDSPTLQDDDQEFEDDFIDSRPASAIPKIQQMEDEQQEETYEQENQKENLEEPVEEEEEKEKDLQDDGNFEELPEEDPPRLGEDNMASTQPMDQDPKGDDFPDLDVPDF